MLYDTWNQIRRMKGSTEISDQRLTSGVALHNEDLWSFSVGGAAVRKLAGQGALHKYILSANELSRLLGSFRGPLRLNGFADDGIEGTAIPFQYIWQFLSQVSEAYGRFCPVQLGLWMWLETGHWLACNDRARYLGRACVAKIRYRCSALEGGRSLQIQHIYEVTHQSYYPYTSIILCDSRLIIRLLERAMESSQMSQCHPQSSWPLGCQAESLFALQTQGFWPACNTHIFASQ